MILSVFKDFFASHLLISLHSLIHAHDLDAIELLWARPIVLNLGLLSGVSVRFMSRMHSSQRPEPFVPLVELRLPEQE